MEVSEQKARACPFSGLFHSFPLGISAFREQPFGAAFLPFPDPPAIYNVELCRILLTKLSSEHVEVQSVLRLQLISPWRGVGPLQGPVSPKHPAKLPTASSDRSVR